MAVRRLAQQQPATFAFTPENQAWAEAKVRDYPEGRQASAVIPILWKAQEQHNGWLPEPAIRLVADMLGMPYIRVLEVATFYTMFQLGPVGRIAHVNVCGTTPCMLRGSEDIIAVCRKKIAPRPFELSPDGRFSWEEVECAGACVNAPMVQIGKDTFEDLTPASFEALLDTLARGGTPTPGPQSARHASEPITGPTTLTSPAKDDHAEAGPEDEAAPDATPDSDVDPTSPAAANQKAARPDPRDRPNVEATRLSDAPERNGSPVAPEPQTSGQPGGVDEPGRQKSAMAADETGGASGPSEAPATTGDAQPGAGIETLSTAEAADQRQANRAAPQAEFADAAPGSGSAAEPPASGESPDTAEAAPQSPPSVVTHPAPADADAAAGTAAADAHAQGDTLAAPDESSRPGAAASDALAQGAGSAEMAPAQAAFDTPGGGSPGDGAEAPRDPADTAREGVWGEDAHADAASGTAEMPVGASAGTAATVAEDADAAARTAGAPEFAGEATEPAVSEAEVEEAMDEGTLVDVAPPAPGTTGDPATHNHGSAPAADAPAPRASEAVAGDDLPEPPDPGAAARADVVGRRPPPLRAEDVTPDNLQRISGIGPVLEKTLHKLGIFTLTQIAAWDQANKDWVATYLAFKGRIDRERWVEQAQDLLARDKGA